MIVEDMDLDYRRRARSTFARRDDGHVTSGFRRRRHRRLRLRHVRARRRARLQARNDQRDRSLFRRSRAVDLATITTPMAAPACSRRWSMRCSISATMTASAAMSAPVSVSPASSIARPTSTPFVPDLSFSDTRQRPCLAGHSRRALRGQPEHRLRPEVSLLQHSERSSSRRQRAGPERVRSRGQLRSHSLLAEPDLQLRGAAAAAAAPAASAAASAAASGDADVPGRFGDPGDRQLPAAAASASAAAAGARARLREASAG